MSKLNQVMVSGQCVGDDGVRRLSGICIGPNIILHLSRIFQLPAEAGSDISLTGSALMSVQNPATLLFKESVMSCAPPRFAVFKQSLVKTSTSSTEYSCRPCSFFQISLTAAKVSLEELSNATNVDRCFFANGAVLSDCPFAVVDCTTFVRVSNGFWTNFSQNFSHSGALEKPHRCPLGYCGCINSINGSCPFPPLISINRNRDPLCTGKRTGKLCGGCLPNFTQSMDGVSCIGNEVCKRNLWWLWTVSILGFFFYSLYIALSCGEFIDNSVTCVMFYLQMSSYAFDPGDSDFWFEILQISQFRSIFSFEVESCYALDMSAYHATAFQLTGPFFVLIFSAPSTWILRRIRARLQQHNINISVSYSGTLAATILYVFSSVADVVFTLVECTSYDGFGVVFIDGTVPCLDSNWKGLMTVVVLLCLFPLAFFAALWWNKLPEDAREVICGNFTQPVFYWEALTLAFRLLVSAIQFLQVDYPNLLASMRMILSLGVFTLLMILRPHVSGHTFWVDVVCYTCLIVQFGLQSFFANVDYFAITFTERQEQFAVAITNLSLMFRFSC
jgi:hypothetical protein